MADDDGAEDPGTAGLSLADMARIAGVPMPAEDLAAAAADADYTPPSVTRFLMPHERQVIAVRAHQARLAGPGAAFGLGLLAAIALNGWAYSVGHASVALIRPLWVAWMAAAAWSAYRYATWRVDWFVLSSVRALHVWGLVKRHVDELPISKLRDVKYTQTIPGRALGYATFEFASIATDHSLRRIPYMPWPEAVHREISRLISPASGAAGPKLHRTEAIGGEPDGL